MTRARLLSRVSRLVLVAAAAVALPGLLVACSGPRSAPVAAGSSAAASTPLSEPSTASPGPGPVVTAWPAPTSSPQIAVAQSEIGSVGSTLLTWASQSSPVGVSVDYITDYTPGAGFAVPAGQRAIQLDIRIVNASSKALDLSGWSIYADIDDKPLAAIKDSNYVDIATLPALAANSNGYLPARVLIPSAGATVLIGVTNPAYPNQPATFAATLS